MKRLNRQLIKLLEMETVDLAGYLAGKLTELYGDAVKYATEDYIFAEGNIPVMLVAHMDTVFSNPPKVQVLTDGILTSNKGLGADDRAGIFAILKIIDDGYRPYILFTNDEEIGCIGARKFVDRLVDDDVTINVNFLIELDRKGKKDAVFYDCDNRKFQRFIESYGFKTAYGSFTDICVIAPVVGAAAVNLSVGYYRQHTHGELLIVSELMETIRKVKTILDSNTKHYEYVSAYVDNVNTWDLSTFGKLSLGKKKYTEVLTESFDDDTIEAQIARYTGYQMDMDDYQIDW